jgi:hypothetical protein
VPLSLTAFSERWPSISRRVGFISIILKLKLTRPDNSELLEIDGIDPEKVSLYGPRFLKLVQRYQHSYESMMRQQEDVPEDPNHRTVVDLLSSDDEDEPLLPEEEYGISSQEEESSYFSNPAVNQFNERRKSPYVCAQDIANREFSISITEYATSSSKDLKIWLQALSEALQRWFQESIR